jgi:thioredoxin 1
MAASASVNVIEVDDSNFDEEVLGAKVPVLVDFGAAWCGPCKVLAPIVVRLADEMVGKVKVVMVDTDDAPRTAERYGVRGVPTVLVFRDGEKRAQHLGATSKERLIELLTR